MIDDAPPLLALRGNPAAFAMPMVAVVGSRIAFALLRLADEKFLPFHDRL